MCASAGRARRSASRNASGWPTSRATWWGQDSQAGAAVDLSNDFTFGRGVGKPPCRDGVVKEVVDEAWDDADQHWALNSDEGFDAVKVGAYADYVAWLRVRQLGGLRPDPDL